ncbi:MAG: gamma-glutamyltransferase, partial [Pseudomonadota bacterium]
AAAARAPQPGTLSAADLADYRVSERPAVCHPYRGTRVCGRGPPSSGATTVGQILMLMDQFETDGMDLVDPGLWHLFAEASRLAYADRGRYLADADFVKVPVRGLLDPGYIGQRSRLIDPAAASTEKATAGEPPWREGRRHAPDLQEDLPGTTHVSVVDADGLAISLTASIETAFGSGRMAGGFLLNNQLTDFSFRPSNAEGQPIANRVEPGKRPRSSMSPTIVLQDGKPVILTGSPGGSRIPEYVAQSIIAILGHDADPSTAAAFPHVSQRNRGTVVIEPEMPDSVRQGLIALGHELEEKPLTSGIGTILVAPDGTLRGGADPRREGMAAGQ